MNDPGNSTAETITLRIHAAISEIAPEAWDACAGDINPTVSHVFLSALEESGSCTARSGWAPQHLSFADPAGRVIGVVPMYLKSHSYGEYVCDWGWADAFERASGRSRHCMSIFRRWKTSRRLAKPGSCRASASSFTGQKTGTAISTTISR